jgi:type IV secretory pathway VirB10-like protein
MNMTIEKSRHGFVIAAAFVVIAYAALASFYHMTSGGNDTPAAPNPPASGKTDAVSGRPERFDPVRQPAPIAATGIAPGGQSAVDVQRLAKKYGASPEEHTAYAEQVKKKQENKAAHDAALSNFRASLRAMQKTAEAPSSDAVLRPPW